MVTQFKRKKILVPLIYAFFGSLFLVSYFSSLTKSSFFVFLSFFLVAHIFNNYKPNRSALYTASCLGFLFSFSIVFGYSYDANNSYSLVFKNTQSLNVAMLAMLSLHVFTTSLISIIFSVALNQQSFSVSIYDHKNFFLFSFIIIAAGTIPYLILYYPGLNIYDTHDQILQFFGFPSYIGNGTALSDHHPVLLTVLYGIFIKLGIALGNASIGQAIYSIISVTAISLCFSFALTYLYKHGMPVQIGFILSFFIAVWPVTALYAFNMCKDVTVAPAILLFSVLMLDLHFSNGFCFKSFSYCISFIICSMLILMMRKSAFAALIFTGIIFLIFYKPFRIQIISLFSVIISLFLAYQVFILPAFHVIPGESREMLSIPFQQTARYLLTYPEDITQSESVSIFRILDQNSIQNYDPRLSDPIKDTSNPTAAKKDYYLYFKAWLSMGLRHPGVYFDAWFNMIYGYFYPSENNTILCLTLNSPDVDNLILKQNESLQSLRLRFYNFVYYTLRRLPIIGQLFYVPCITWSFLILSCVLFLKFGKKGIVPWAFFIGNLSISLFSPKSGEIRYLLPILYVIPIMIGLTTIGKDTP